MTADPFYGGQTPELLVLMDAEFRLRHSSRSLPDGVGAPALTWLEAKDHAQVRAAAACARDTGLPQRLEVGTVQPSGGRYSCWIADVSRDGETTFALTGHDVSEIRRARDNLAEREHMFVQLRDSEARYRLLVERSPEAIVVLDLDSGFFAEANPAAEELFELSREELLQRSPGSVSPEIQPDGCLSATAAGVQIMKAVSGERAHFEWTHLTASGEHVPCEIWLSRLPHASRMLVQGNITDLRQRKAAEAEQRRLTAQLLQASKLQAIGQLTGGVAHDFNNLLTVIMGSLDLIGLSGGGVEEVNELLAAAREAAQRGSALTHRMLAFARKQPLQPKHLNLDQLIAGMQDLLRRTLGETIEIETQISSDVWPCLADPTQLESVILNLAINARDAMQSGGTLTLAAANLSLDPDQLGEHDELHAGDYVVVSASDTGSGIAPELVDKVFDPFFTTKGVGEGSGLGLSMVFGFAKQSGGHAKLASELGQGTTVKLYLPRAVGDAPLRQIRSTVGSDPVGSGELILVVEDDPRLRKVSLTLLERLGYRTVAAGDGAEGLKQLEVNPDVQLLFTDVVLPGGMSGVDLAQAAAGLRPGLRVLFTSGYTADALISQGQVQEDVELLEKPFSVKQLARRVRKILGKA